MPPPMLSRMRPPRSDSGSNEVKHLTGKVEPLYFAAVNARLRKR